MTVKKGVYFKKHLNEELKNRCLRNPSYSLRSFAKDIGFDASNLCKYMNGSLDITDRFYLSLRKSLELPQETLEVFERENARLYSEKSILHLEDESVFSMGGLQCLIMIEILNLTTLETTTPNIAKIFGLSEELVESTLLEMQTQGIAIRVDEKWKSSNQIVKTNFLPKDNHDSDPVMSLFRSYTQSMIQSLTSDPSTRHLQFSLVSTNSSMIKEAHQKLRNYREDLMNWLETAEVKDTTFGIGISMFPLISTVEGFNHAQKNKHL